MIWTFFVRGIVFGQTSFLNIKNLAYNMDSGYWFLFSIYVISVIFGISEFISNKRNKGKNKYKEILLTSVFFVVGAIVLGGIGLFMGLDFLCIKLTLYYMPFYLSGFIFGKVQDTLTTFKIYDNAKEIIVAICIVIYVFMLLRYSLFSMDENIFGIAIKYISSILGCVVICSLVPSFCANRQTKTTSALKWVGANSLEVYLVHYLVLNLFRFEQPIEFLSPKGALLVIGNFAATVVFAVIIIKLLNQNKVLKKLLFGKK